MAQWFIYKQDKVQGPYSTEDLKSLVGNGELDKDILIWGKPSRHWLSVDRWQIDLPALLENTKDEKDNRLWHFALDGNSQGPFTRDQLLDELRNLKSTQDVLLWTKGMKSWSPIYEFFDIMDDIGFNRRQCPRAALDGKLVVKVGDLKRIGKIVTVSEGGFGASNLNDLVIGETYPVEIQSPVFSEPVNAKAQLRYRTETGFCGFQFTSLNSESKAKIIQHVKGISPSKRAA